MPLHRLLIAPLLLLAPLMAGAEGPARPEVVAHRGASWVAPENTLASVRLAWDLDADAAEIDVYLSADNRVVVMHDKDLKRTAGLDKPVAETDWATLRELDAGSWKGPRWAGEPIPTLEQILRTVPAGKRLFVEVKCGPEIVPHLVRLFAESGKSADQLVIISFNHDVCVQAKKALPNHKVYFLSGFKKDEGTGELKPDFDTLIQRATAGGLDGLDVSFRGPITAENVAKVHAAGLELHVYTVNEIEDARRLAEAGVNGITTDRPDFIMDGAFAATRSEVSNSSAAPKEQAP